jgi:hypothetical protein
MPDTGPPLHQHEARARWHLEIGYAEPAADDDRVDFDYQDDGHCLDCGQIHDMCECHVGAECGRWRNGSLSRHCLKAGSEECDFECPYRNSLRF